jgi:hypothetical protein
MVVKLNLFFALSQHAPCLFWNYAYMFFLCCIALNSRMMYDELEGIRKDEVVA